MGILIPSSRLKWIPTDVRLAHEYCFFLHDEIGRMLVEYEKADAHTVRIDFSNKAEEKRFLKLSEHTDPISVLKMLGRSTEARKVVLNTITMAMVSDCAQHIFEALRCLEKGKITPALNLLRKPLLDSLVYFTWMLADEEGFHKSFTSGDPTQISQKFLGNRRRDLVEMALSAVELTQVMDTEDLISMLFDAADPHGLYGLFQHAVHLVTIDRVEIRTTPENFNFIFSPPADADMYRSIYSCLPTVLLYLTRVITVLCERISPMNKSSSSALEFRSLNGYLLVLGGDAAEAVTSVLNEALASSVMCPGCKSGLRVTRSNAAKLVLADSFQCIACRRKHSFPLAWMF